MSREEVEKALGKPDAVQPQGKTGTVDMNYGSRGFAILVSKTRGAVIITCMSQAVMAVRVNDFRGKTDKGIALGASSADIIRAYGQPDSKETEQGTTHLSYMKQLEMSFTLFDDKLVSIWLSRQRPGP
jgi:hypothetical protein